jgi:2,4-dienoyl-CoA reductase-like NADH-dependent reductase (Old Yellow Enzyme family)/thioredoxin reductase
MSYHIDFPPILQYNVTQITKGSIIMKHLFTPFQLKHIEFKNRIVMSPLASFLFAEGGGISEALLEHYRCRAAGGPAMVIVEAVAVSADGRNSEKNGRIDHDRYTAGLAKLAQVIKSEGSVAGIQIYHCGRQTPPRVVKKKPLAPSALPCPAILAEVSPMTIDDIQQKVLDFGQAAVRAKEAGFELVEIHGAHGYLINQFLSAFSNIREDAYGGDTPARARFAAEVIAEVRRCLGPEFPLSFKISAQEFVPNGLNVTESTAILKILVSAGIDLVQVSGGNDATPEWICQPMFMKKACFAENAGRIRRQLDIPVMTVGRINDPHLAETLIQERRADLVCMGRGLLADPELPKKAAAGRFEDIRRCIACNTCMESIFKNGSIQCLVNPVLGRELEMTLSPARKRKRILVVGGGPGGMTVAATAAQRGHAVDLYEKRPTLGGQLVPGSRADFKQDIQHLIRYLHRQLEEQGVSCHLDHEVTPEEIQQSAPDAIVLATGSIPLLPPIPGIDLEHVKTYADVLDTPFQHVSNAVVVGGGATGCELALHLANTGCTVTIVEMLPDIALQLESITRKVLLKKLEESGVNLLTEHRLDKIGSTGVVVKDQSGAEKAIEAQCVVIAVGTAADTRLYEEIENLDCAIFRIGDCLEARSAKAAIYEGAKLGREL